MIPDRRAGTSGNREVTKGHFSQHQPGTSGIREVTTGHQPSWMFAPPLSDRPGNIRSGSGSIQQLSTPDNAIRRINQSHKIGRAAKLPTNLPTDLDRCAENHEARDSEETIIEESTRSSNVTAAAGDLVEDTGPRPRAQKASNENGSIRHRDDLYPIVRYHSCLVRDIRERTGLQDGKAALAAIVISQVEFHTRRCKEWYSGARDWNRRLGLDSRSALEDLIGARSPLVKHGYLIRRVDARPDHNPDDGPSKVTYLRLGPHGRTMLNAAMKSSMRPVLYPNLVVDIDALRTNLSSAGRRTRAAGAVILDAVLLSQIAYHADLGLKPTYPKLSRELGLASGDVVRYALSRLRKNGLVEAIGKSLTERGHNLVDEARAYADSKRSTPPTTASKAAPTAERSTGLPDTPQAILERLRTEIREKYGDREASGVDRALSGKEIGQLKTVLKKHDPQVILNMIRLLVWDWEVVREAHFPTAKGVSLPAIKHLIRYRTELASNIDYGYEWSGQQRGASKTYRNRYRAEDAITAEEFQPF